MVAWVGVAMFDWVATVAWWVWAWLWVCGYGCLVGMGMPVGGSRWLAGWLNACDFVPSARDLPASLPSAHVLTALHTQRSSARERFAPPGYLYLSQAQCLTNCAVLCCPVMPPPPPCSGTIPSQWGQLAELEVLRMRHNVLTGSLPAGAMAAAHTHTRMHKSILKSPTILKSSTDLSHDWLKAASKRSELS